MLLVRVGRNNESVSALRPPHSQLIAYPICFFWRNLSGIEGLTDLIAQHIRTLLLFPACHGLVAGLCQKKLGGYRGRVALIGRYVFPVLRLFRVFPIVQTITNGLGYTFSFVGVALQQGSCCQRKSLPSQKTAAMQGRRLYCFGTTWPEAISL